MTYKDTPFENVSDTSFWVAHYRAKESERPDSLFNDPFAKLLSGEHGKKIADAMNSYSQYTEWAVISRTVIIDRLIEKLITQGVDAVINLGTGLDARPYRMNLPKSLAWIEVDYPNIVQHKTELLKSESPRCQLTRFAVDLADDDKRRSFLNTVVPDAKNVVILTEGVIPYLSEEQVADLAKDLRTHPRFQFWIAEYFHPKVYPYLQRAKRSFKMQNTPFQFYPQDWFGFFKKCGWNELETRFNGEIAVEFRRKPPMPWWVGILVRFLPERVKAESMRMTGYVVFKRAEGNERN